MVRFLRSNKVRFFAFEQGASTSTKKQLCGVEKFFEFEVCGASFGFGRPTVHALGILNVRLLL